MAIIGNPIAVTASDYVIEVTAPTGSTVTASLGGDTYTSVEDNGTWRLEVDEAGTYTVTVTKDGRTCTDTVTVPQTEEFFPSLEETSWADISRVAKAGKGSVHWNIGDTKTITLNGYIGNELNLSNLSLKVFILDFNHGENGVPDNNILFGGFKTLDGVDVALCGTRYGTTVGNGYFSFNRIGYNADPQITEAGNYGGWKGSDLRYDIGATEVPPYDYNYSGGTKTVYALGFDATAAAITNPRQTTQSLGGSLLAALPSDFRSVLRLRTHYVDNSGGIEGNPAGVTGIGGNISVSAATDAVSLLTEYEVFGAISGSNPNEQYKQSQMAYYALGNSKVKYKHNDTAVPIQWHLGSPIYVSTTNFCGASTSGTSSSFVANLSLGIAPVFKV